MSSEYVTDDIRREVAKKFIEDFLVNTQDINDKVSKKRLRALYKDNVPEQFRFPAPRAKAFFSLLRSHLNIPAQAMTMYMIGSARLFPHGEEVSISSFKRYMDSFQKSTPLPSSPKPTPQPTVSTPKQSQFHRAGSQYPELCIASTPDHYLVRIFISAEDVELTLLDDIENALVIEYKGRIFMPHNYQIVSKSNQTKMSIYLQLPHDADTCTFTPRVEVQDHWIDVYVGRAMVGSTIATIDLMDPRNVVQATTAPVSWQDIIHHGEVDDDDDEVMKV
ncbi:hypothetical protein P9112_013346 [Eukaryota sp. TZLM1-RC]